MQRYGRTLFADNRHALLAAHYQNRLIDRDQIWTPALVKASYNYQLSRTEPGAWAHNFDYMAQPLYDSVADLGGSVVGLVRP